jgi:dienelactone hydrolase
MKTIRKCTMMVVLVVAACGGSAGEPVARSDAQALTGGAPALAFTVAGRTMTAGADVTPMHLGDRVSFTATGFAPGAHVKIRAARANFAASATFATDANGAVDTAHAAPLAGSYDGADADGLFWSMTPVDGQALDPFTFVFSVLGDDGTVLASASLRPEVDPAVKFTQIDDDGLVGILAAPTSGGAQHPAVLVIGGSEGDTSTSAYTASFLASHGYVALALAWWGVPGLPTAMDHVPIEYFEKGVARLAGDPRVDEGKIAVMGTSRGSEAALLVGAHVASVRAVIGVVPSGVTLEGNDATSPTWTWRDAPVPFIVLDPAGATEETLPDGRVAERQSTAYAKVLADPHASGAAEIPVEQTNGPLLLLAAGDDGLWPSCALGGLAFDRLARAHHAYDDAIVCYPGAGHLIGLPGLPTTDRYFDHPTLHVLLDAGGTPVGTAHAQRDATERILAFLAKRL